MLQCRPKLRCVSFVVKTYCIQQSPPHSVRIRNYNSMLHGNRTATEIQLFADNYVHIYRVSQNLSHKLLLVIPHP